MFRIGFLLFFMYYYCFLCFFYFIYLLFSGLFFFSYIYIIYIFFNIVYRECKSREIILISKTSRSPSIIAQPNLTMQYPLTRSQVCTCTNRRRTVCRGEYKLRLIL